VRQRAAPILRWYCTRSDLDQRTAPADVEQRTMRGAL
jgi:hypothetical protein